ncbi:MAG TPA: L-fucose:H+ symporter permease [Terriglobales bacterium]|jgi:FHS family L-fucose permease-like MFS transporter|nr:L-fucose:H+ symporter permease [Terriglobales bacterium]
MTSHSVPLTERKYYLPFVLVTSLFFLWAIGVNLNDVLIPHLKKAFELTDFQSSLIQVAFFGGYFLAAFPAGKLMEKIGYKGGIVLGLLICATGTLLFLPAANSRIYAFFLLALFVMSSGQSFLEVGANPYVTVLGPAESSERRLNFAQSFNAVGAVLVPLLGSAFILSGVEYTHEQRVAMTPQQLNAYIASEANMVKIPYLIITALFLAVAALIFFSHLPEVSDEKKDASGKLAKSSDDVWAHPHLIKGVIAQFFYVGAQVGVGSFVIRFTKHTMPDTLDKISARFAGTKIGEGRFFERLQAHLTPNSVEKAAALFLVAHQFGFMIGRFFGSAIMKRIPAPKLLAVFGIGALICVAIGISAPGLTSVLAIVLVGFFNSIMFPTIFALSLKNLGPLTKRGSSLLVMSIIGGALIPAAMGEISDLSNIRIAFIMPLICYAYVTYFAIRGYKTTGEAVVGEEAAASGA